MRSPSSPSVHNGRHEKHSHRNSPLPRLLLEAAGVMTLVLGVIATSPAGGERTQEHAVTHDFELVDMEPLDTGDDEAMMEESDDGTSAETQTEETDTEESEEPFENCDEARAEGQAPVDESHPRFGEHLDRDKDGTGCENWSGTGQESEDPAQAPQNSQYDTCTEARADGKTDIQDDDPAYAEHLDGDKDGVACES